MTSTTRTTVRSIQRHTETDAFSLVLQIYLGIGHLTDIVNMGLESQPGNLTSIPTELDSHQCFKIYDGDLCLCLLRISSFVPLSKGPDPPECIVVDPDIARQKNQPFYFVIRTYATGDC